MKFINRYAFAGVLSLTLALSVSAVDSSKVVLQVALDTNTEQLPVVRDSVLDVTATRGPMVVDELIQAKLDSLTQAVEAKTSVLVEVNSDSLAKVKADSIRAKILDGQYIKRAHYDKSNFDHWKLDTLFQQEMKLKVTGSWRTSLVPHGHAFRDAELRFGVNDTLYGVTRTYSDSGRYQMTGEYSFQARYRFENDSTIVSREVFSDRKVVRWDYISFSIRDNQLTYHLKKLEFRDLNDNWLNALQGFDHVNPEIYYREKVLPSSSKAKK